jgi:hypothetical protein
MTQALNQFENILKSAITNEVMKERKKWRIAPWKRLTKA